MKNKLNDLNIYALRELARHLGVKSPTSKKKEELIENIINIQTGKVQPETALSKQGRPPKNFGYNFIDKLDVFDNSLTKVSLNQDVEDYENNNIETVAGYIELINNNSAFFWIEINNKYINYFVPAYVVETYNLRTGDRIVAKLLREENRTIVSDIFSINSCPKAKYNNNRNNFLEIEPVLPKKTLTFNVSDYNNFNFKLGENSYFYGNNNNMNTCAIIDIMNACKCENKIYINVSVAEKNKMFLNNITDAEKFTANITDETDTIKRVLNLAVERAKRLFEFGEDVLIVVDDMLSVVEIDNVAKNLVALAKQGKKSGSITLFAVMPNNNLSQLEKLADKRFKIVDNNIIIVD